ncbi:MAG: SRPBCC family protein [Gammaproteobacteria bacterium]|nr:SRPBCC family protein [Gammaproteobacteria bacterium]
MADRIAFDHSRHGRIGKLDDNRVYVAFERQLSHPIDKVWRAISDPDELERWFPGIKIELKLGGKFKIWFGDGCEGSPHVSGIVEEFEPPNLLQIGTMRYELEANSAGCMLKFSDVLAFNGPRTRQQFAVSVLAGWHAYLDTLELVLDGKSDGRDLPEKNYATIDVPGWEIL